MTGLIFDNIMMKHQYRPRYYGDTHPEQSNRISEIYNKLETNKLTDLCTHIPIRPATEAEILTTHTQEYLNQIKTSHNASDKVLNNLEKKYNSIYLNQSSYSSALYSCGGVIELCEQVISDKLQTGITSCITQLSCGSSTQTIHLSFNIVGEFKIKIRKDASNIGKTLKLESDSEQEIKVTVVEDVSLWIKIKKLIN